MWDALVKAPVNDRAGLSLESERTPMNKLPRRPRYRVGVMTHPDPDLKSHYFSETLRGIRRVLTPARAHLRINPDPAEVDGLLLIGPSPQDPVWRISARKGIPAVVINGGRAGFPSVDTDNAAAAYAVVRRFAALGHRRIGIINGKMRTDNGRDRFRGYRAALRASGLRFERALAVGGNFDRAQGRKAMARLLALARPPTAVFAANDHMAAGAIEAIRARGLRVPGDVAVAGFDDVPEAARIRPALSTVRQPFADMGRRGARLLWEALARLRKPGRAPVIRLRADLVIRRSCGGGRHGPRVSGALSRPTARLAIGRA
jgi:LacI family transcriptional regulator